MEWVGFDVDSGCLACLDTSGMLRVLLRVMGSQWVPVLDLIKARKSSVHRLWPVAIKGKQYTQYTHPINTPYQSILSTHPINPSSQHNIYLPTQIVNRSFHPPHPLSPHPPTLTPPTNTYLLNRQPTAVR